MKWVKLADMLPVDAPYECPCNCAECKHLKGVIYHSWGEVDIQCDLDEYNVDCVISR